MGETRKLAAILVADIVGFSRLAGSDEQRTLARIRALRGDLVDPAVAAHHGRIVKGTGDGFIVEFRSVVDAARCAIEIQNGLVERNAGVPAERRIEFRIGIYAGEVVEESDGDLMGDAVKSLAERALRSPSQFFVYKPVIGASSPNTQRSGNMLNTKLLPGYTDDDFCQAVDGHHLF